MYKQIEYKAGAVIEVIKCIPRGCRKGQERSKVKKKTKEEMQQANMRQAARKLARKINANFRPGDWHITLTYRPKERPNEKEAQQNIKKFLDQMRKRYRQEGFNLKYIMVTEYKNKSIHHHLIINHVNDGKKTTTDYVRQYWKGRGNPKFIPLYDNGEYKTLAEYLIKETEKTFREGSSPVKQRYSCSRNLVPAKRKEEIRKSKTWKEEPAPRLGYYIDQDSVYNGLDKFGFRYQRYVMIKIKPEETDWAGSSWPPDS